MGLLLPKTRKNHRRVMFAPVATYAFRERSFLRFRTLVAELLNALDDRYLWTTNERYASAFCFIRCPPIGKRINLWKMPQVMAKALFTAGGFTTTGLGRNT